MTPGSGTSVSGVVVPAGWHLRPRGP